MTFFEENRVKSKTNFFLIVILFYLIGPTTYRFANAYLADILFALFFVYALMSGTKLRLTHRVSLVFLVPFVIVLGSNIGKYWSDFPLGVDEFANTVKSLQLFFLVSFSSAIFDPRMNEDYFNLTLNKFSVIISCAVIYNGLIGIFQYFEVGAINKFLETFYYIELDLVEGIEGVSNADMMVVENRITGIFESWNGIGFFLTQTLFLLLLIYRERKSILILPAIGIGFLALVLAGSRAAIIGFIIAWTLYSLYITRSKKALFVVLFAFFVSVPAIILMKEMEILPEENVQRFVEIYDFMVSGEVPATLAFRLDTWSWMPQHIISSPYFLFGYPNEVWKSSIYFWGADSQYVAWLLVYGLFGLTLFVMWSLIVIYVFRKEYLLFKTVTGNSVVTRLCGAFVVIFFTYLFIGISQDSMLSNRWRELLLSFIGFVVSWGIHSQRSAHSKHLAPDA